MEFLRVFRPHNIRTLSQGPDRCGVREHGCGLPKRQHGWRTPKICLPLCNLIWLDLVYGMKPRPWMPAGACPRVGEGGHDGQAVIPAKAGIQEPYIQLQAALAGVYGKAMFKNP